jgi:4-alpha-glucanotransferase
MNIPSHPEDNWTWRMERNAITPELTRKIAQLIEVSDRDPVGAGQSKPKPKEEFAA